VSKRGKARSLGPWWRFYVSSLDDAKLDRLSDAAFRGWTKLMCVATENGGIIPDDMTTLSFRLRRPSNKVRELLQTLLSAELLERCGDGFIPHNWEERQFDSDVSTSRVKEFRERQRKLSGTSDETFHPPFPKLPMKPVKTPEETSLERPHSTEIIEQRTENQKIPKANAFSSEFETWYQAMPRHEARGDAEKAYRSARKSGATADELLAGAKRYAAARNGEDAQFTKTPGPWLRAKKWLDESPKPNGTNGHSVPFEPADLHGWRNRIAAFAEGISAGAEPHECWPPRWGPADGSRVPVELHTLFEQAKSGILEKQ
jgi:hypothetical protein